MDKEITPECAERFIGNYINGSCAKLCNPHDEPMNILAGIKFTINDFMQIKNAPNAGITALLLAIGSSELDGKTHYTLLISGLQKLATPAYEYAIVKTHIYHSQANVYKGAHPQFTYCFSENKKNAFEENMGKALILEGESILQNIPYKNAQEFFNHYAHLPSSYPYLLTQDNNKFRGVVLDRDDLDVLAGSGAASVLIAFGNTQDKTPGDYKLIGLPVDENNHIVCNKLRDYGQQIPPTTIQYL